MYLKCELKFLFINFLFNVSKQGVGMRAEHISKCGWLRPWQSPETILEKMVSVRTEVYSVATIIWEMWSGTILFLTVLLYHSFYLWSFDDYDIKFSGSS